MKQAPNANEAARTVTTREELDAEIRRLTLQEQIEAEMRKRGMGATGGEPRLRIRNRQTNNYLSRSLGSAGLQRNRLGR